MSSAYSTSVMGEREEKVHGVKWNRVSKENWTSCIKTVRTMINRYGLRGHPWRIPREREYVAETQEEEETKNLLST